MRERLTDRFLVSDNSAYYTQQADAHREAIAALTSAIAELLTRRAVAQLFLSRQPSTRSACAHGGDRVSFRCRHR